MVNEFSKKILTLTCALNALIGYYLDFTEVDWSVLNCHMIKTFAYFINNQCLLCNSYHGPRLNKFNQWPCWNVLLNVQVTGTSTKQQNIYQAYFKRPYSSTGNKTRSNSSKWLFGIFAVPTIVGSTYFLSLDKPDRRKVRVSLHGIVHFIR